MNKKYKIYKLTSEGKIPDDIINGGYFPHPITEELIGVTSSESSLTKEEMWDFIKVTASLGQFESWFSYIENCED